MKLLLASGAILGFVSVAFGAYSEHGLKPNVTAEDFRFLMTAVRYNQINSAVICSIGLFILIDNTTSNKLFKISGLTFVAGTVLFSFSIYLSILYKISSIQYLTPVGGITLMAAWLLLLVAALKYKNPASQRAD
jgi:uncharacterized membrane protein YgdD (TMEM256/DUF423 family)